MSYLGGKGERGNRGDLRTYPPTLGAADSPEGPGTPGKLWEEEPEVTAGETLEGPAGFNAGTLSEEPPEDALTPKPGPSPKRGKERK